LKEDGVGLGHANAAIPQEVLDVAAAYEKAIIDGTVKVPADEDELVAFTPVAPDAVGAAATAPAATPTA